VLKQVTRHEDKWKSQGTRCERSASRSSHFTLLGKESLPLPLFFYCCWWHSFSTDLRTFLRQFYWFVLSFDRYQLFWVGYS